MMRFENFIAPEEIHIVNAWLNARGMPSVDETEVPEIGFIAYVEDTPIGAAFLRKCEGDFAMIDSLITNPESSPLLRHHAIDGLVELVIQAAREMEFKKIIGLSMDASTLERAKKHGFRKRPHTLIALDLTGSEQEH